MPPELLAMLMPLQPILSKNGAVLCRKEKNRKHSYRLRYRLPRSEGKRQHRSIPIPETQLEAVKALIAGWRLEEQMRKAEELRRKLLEALETRQELAEERQLVLMAGGGRRRQRRLRGMYDDARKEGLIAEIAFSFVNPCTILNRTRGRKRRAGLTVPQMPEEPVGYKLGSRRHVYEN